ncbi:hypothetical protein TNCV_2550271 [Trichonephila clavipes]|nr:hypothetical protein TNCV_2550271 [Trichonephila clavipes]
MPPVRSRNAYQHVSDFDKGRIVAYWDCDLSYRRIAVRVGRDPMPPRHELWVKNWGCLQNNECLHEQFDYICSSMDSQLGDHGCGSLEAASQTEASSMV